MGTAVTARNVLNYAGFQIGWFVLVLTQSPWAMLWALAFAALHAVWVAKPGEWNRMGAIMAFGLVVDTLWHQTSWVTFNGAGWPLPLWLAGLWLMFPLTLDHSLAWLKQRLWLQCLCGIVGGGGSYIAGSELGAATLQGPAYILLPLSWGLWLPLFYAWNQRISSVQTTEAH